LVTPVPLYDALAADYDRFVDWDGRLAHEMPFFLRLFQGQGVGRILDAACGTGHHALALAGHGYRVVGADLSAPMVERARENAASSGLDVRFARAGLGELATLGGDFDAVLCLGNSLPHMRTALAVNETLLDFAAVLRTGGLLVIQNRNFDRVWTERQRFMPPQSHRNGKEESLFVRLYDFHEEGITFNMIRLQRTAEGWIQAVESTELRPIFRQDLERSLGGAGFGDVAFYGGYDGSPFDPQQSNDLIAVARRG
jgi:glycine/sarcosine N-methyltransferase